jgi:hypothetical protein
MKNQSHDLKPRMRLLGSIAFAVALVLLACTGALAKIQEGSIKTDRNFVFMSKFCFSNDYGGIGNVTFRLRDVDMAHKNLTVLVYYDQENTVRLPKARRFRFFQKKTSATFRMQNFCALHLFLM